MFGIGARVAVEKLREGAERVGSAAGTAGPEAGRPGKPRTAQEAGARVGAGVRQAAAHFRAAQAGAGDARAGAERASGGTRRLAQFGGALVRPFAHATSLLWSQVTGIFFALFAAFFMEHAWMVYRATHWRDRLVLLYGALALTFAWFAVSTFWRVRRRHRG